MIELKNISVFFDQKPVLENISALFPKEGLVLITGPSGSGKTTLVNVILGLVKPTCGEVLLNGAGLSAVFQEDRLVPTLTAAENVLLVSNKTETEKRLEQMKLIDAKEKYPAELSGGMKRRVAIARALSVPFDVLVLDEAFAGIDEPLAREIIGEILAEYPDKLIIAVTHRPELFEGTGYLVLSL